MKLSLVNVLVEMTIEQVAQRATSRRFVEICQNNSLEPNFVILNLTKEINYLDLNENQKALTLQWCISHASEVVPMLAEYLSLNRGNFLVFSNFENFFQFQRFAQIKDLMQIKDLRQLYAIVDQACSAHEQYQSKDANLIDKLKKDADFDKVISNEKYDVFIPNNQAAACFLGLGTRWCTASTSPNTRNYYDHYHEKNDPLIIIFDKQNKVKYQVHVGSKQMMDAEDQQIKDPALKKTLSVLIYPLVKNIKGWDRGENGGLILKSKSEEILGEYSDRDELVELIRKFSQKRSLNLKGANLWGAKLSGVELTDSNLWDADLGGADLSGAKFWESEFVSADLSNANLRNADFQGANLQNANLRHSDLSDANFQHANLAHADLRDTNFRNADFKGANLRGTHMDKEKNAPAIVEGRFTKKKSEKSVNIFSLKEWMSSSPLIKNRLHSADADLNFFNEPLNKFLMTSEEEFDKNQKKRKNEKKRRIK